MKKYSEEEQFKRMTETPVGKLIVSLAIPTVISMLITVIYNTADTFFVSQINKSASAAVSACFSVMSVIQAIGFGFGMGAGSLISLSLGEKNSAKANKYASSAFFSSVGIGLLIGIIPQFFIKPMMTALGCSETMLPYALPYAKVILIIAPVYCATFVLNNVLRAQGETMLSMWGVSAGGILNIILDPVLIFVCKLDTFGAALATAISQIVSFGILMFFFMRKTTVVKIRIKYISGNIKDYVKIITTGMPTIFRQGLGSVASALLNINAVVYGDAAVAAISIASKVYMLIRNIIIGVGQGFQPVAGYNFGAGNKKRTSQAFKFAAKIGTVFCIIFTVITALLSEQIMSWFSNDADVISIGKNTLHILCYALPFLGISTFTNQLFQCLGFKVQATFLASCRQGIFFIPAIMILPKFFEITGVMSAQSVADIFTFIVSVPFLVYFYKKYLNTSDKNNNLS